MSGREVGGWVLVGEREGGEVYMGICCGGRGRGMNMRGDCVFRELTMVHGCMLSSFGGKVDG